MIRHQFKLLYTVVAVLFILASLAGCAQTPAAPSAAPTTAAGAGETAPAQAPVATAAPVQITYWYPLGNDPDKPAIEQATANFTKANPNIIVKAEYVANLPDKLQISINAGTAPDVSMFDRFMIGQWADQGLLTQMDDLCAQYGITKDMFFDGPMGECVLNGKTYALPNVMDARCFYWNKTLFRAAGLDPEKPPTTFAELDQYAEKLTIKSGDRYTQLGFIPWYGQGSIYTYGWAFGGQFLDSNGKVTANDPNIVKALEWMVKYSDKYDIERMNSFQSSAGDIDPFASGTLAMLLNGTWTAKRLPDGFDYGVTYIPTPSGSDSNSWAGGYCFIIPSGAKNVDAAMQFVKSMTAGEGATSYGEATHSLLCNKQLNDAQEWIKSDANAKFFLTLLPISYCRPVISQGKLLSDELDSAQDMALHGKGEPQELLDAVTTKVNAAIGK